MSLNEVLSVLDIENENEWEHEGDRRAGEEGDDLDYDVEFDENEWGEDVEVEEEESDPFKRVMQKNDERSTELARAINSSSLSSSLPPGPVTDLFPELLSSSPSLSLSSEIDSLLNQVEGLPNDPLGFAEIAKYLERDANQTIDPSDKARLEEMKSAIKRPIEEKFKQFIELIHGKFDGDDRALSLFAATAIHAQLFGPTRKNDMESVSRVLPFVKSMLFAEEKDNSEKTDLEQAIGETSRKEMEILSSILDQVNPERLRIHSLKLSDLKYTKLYPKVVLQWVLDAKTPYGYYGEDGYWVPEPMATETYSAIKEKQMVGLFSLSLSLSLPPALPFSLSASLFHKWTFPTLFPSRTTTGCRPSVRNPSCGR